MKFSNKYGIIASLFIIVVVTAAPLLAFDLGEKAPDFKLKSTAGEEISLSEFRGRVVLLKLATTWCPTCKQLSGEIRKIGDELKAKDAVYLEVFVQDSAKMVEKYISEDDHPMTFHALLDDGRAYKDYNVYLIPRLLVIDAQQRVRFDSAGQNVKAEEIVSLVDEAGAATAARDSS